MVTKIDESVSVDLLSNHLTNKVYPWVIRWRGRRYTVTKVGLHYMTHSGRTLIHNFSVTDGVTCFSLAFNTETLLWKLIEINTDHE